MNASELKQKFDQIIPKELSCEWDNDGLMVSSDSTKDIKKALLTLDITPKAVERAVMLGVDAVFTHHPFIFKPLKNLCDSSERSCLIFKLIKNNIAVFSYHTRLDSVEGGVNDVLANSLGLENVHPLGDGELSMARIGQIRDTSLDELSCRVKQALKAPSVILARSAESNRIERVAVLGGSCDREFVYGALDAGADVLVTGDASYNLLLDANLDGLSVICAGHYSSENPVLSFFERELTNFGVEIFRFDCGYFEYL